MLSKFGIALTVASIRASELMRIRYLWRRVAYLSRGWFRKMIKLLIASIADFWCIVMRLRPRSYCIVPSSGLIEMVLIDLLLLSLGGEIVVDGIAHVLVKDEALFAATSHGRWDYASMTHVDFTVVFFSSGFGRNVWKSLSFLATEIHVGLRNIFSNFIFVNDRINFDLKLRSSKTLI